MTSVFAYIKQLISGGEPKGKEEEDGEDELVRFAEFGEAIASRVARPMQTVIAVLIYPGGMTTTLYIPTRNAEKVEEFIHAQLGNNASSRMFHLGVTCEDGQFQGCEVWHDSSLYDAKDYNRKASLHLKMPLYGKVVVVNGNVDPNQYDNLPLRLLNTLSRALPPVPRSRSSQSPSKPGKRSRRTSPPPDVVR